jgi:hypothetical protein
MSVQSLSSEPPDIPDRRSRFHPAWILGLAAVGTVGVLAAFALPGGSDHTPTPVPTTATTATTAPTSEQSIAPESTSTTTEIAPPELSSPTPGPHDRAKGRARSHNKKDGKQ